MKRRQWPGAHAFLYILAVARLLTPCALPYVQEDEVASHINEIVLQTEGGDKDREIRNYAISCNVPMAEIEQVLLKNVTISPDAMEKEQVLAYQCTASIAILGKLRAEVAVPLLEEISFTTSDSVRRAIAVRSVIKIGSKELLDFARLVIDDKETFSYMDRYTLYEELSPYVGVKNWKPEKDQVQMDNSGRDVTAEVKKFLLEAVAKETYNSGIWRLDRTLAIADQEYAKSDFRAEVLTKLGKSSVARHRDYAAGELRNLKEMPAENRVRLPYHVQDVDALTTGGPVR